MTTKFAIVDAGGFVTGEWRDGKLVITNSCGCPADAILQGIRRFSDPERLARAILNRWVSGGGYEGGWSGARENRLYVSVNDGEGTASA